MISLLIIEDDATLREFYGNYFSATEGFELLGAFESAEALFNNYKTISAHPNILLLDIVLSGKSGIDAIARIKELWPSINVVMLSVMEDAKSIFSSLCEGAVGYLTKDYELKDIKTALIDINEGRGNMSPSIARKVAEYFHPKEKLTEKLTERELDIVKGILDGLSYKLIAERYLITIDIVRKNIKSIYHKLQINSKSQLMKLYFNR